MAVSTHVKTARKTFRDLLPFLTSSHPLTSHVAMLTVNFAIDQDEPSTLAAHGWAMIRQIFNIIPKDLATVRSRELLVMLKLEEFDLILREIWLNYFGHAEHSSGAFS